MTFCSGPFVERSELRILRGLLERTPVQIWYTAVEMGFALLQPPTKRLLLLHFWDTKIYLNNNKQIASPEERE